MRKIKILHFPIRNTNGGITRTAIKYWKHIDKSRFQFGFATCEKVHLDFERELIDSGAEVHYISCYAEEDENKFASELGKILIENKYDAIHLNTSWWRSFTAEKVAKDLGVKVILVHARSSGIDISDNEKRLFEYERHQQVKANFCKDMATDYAACSKAAAEFLFGTQIPEDKIVILHNALDIGRFSYSEIKRNMMREQLNAEKSYVIGNIGRMSYVKNHNFLLECFYEVQMKIQSALLLLVGDGELRENIIKQAEKLGIADKVIFTGKVDNVEDYLQAMDVFAFPTRFEGLGNVLIEAQTAGLKCVSSDNVPMETSITDNIEYLPLEKDLWVKELVRLSKQYERKDMGGRVREAGYDIQSEIKILENIYLKALQIN